MKPLFCIIITFCISIGAFARIPPVSDSISENVEFVGATGGPVYDVFVQGNYAYLCTREVLIILDISVPDYPTKVGNITLPYPAESVYVSEIYAYVADGDYGLRVIDVSNPQNPVGVGYYDTPGKALGVYVSEIYAYMADGDYGLRVIDVSSPGNPMEVGFYNTPGYAESVFVSGNYAYVADTNEGLRIIDVSNPKNPVEVGAYDTYDAKSVYVSGSYAYVTFGYSGLRIIDVSNPKNPVNVSSYNTPGHAVGIYVSGNYAYVTDNFRGLCVIDVSNPQNPVEVGFYDTPGNAYGVYVSGNYAYVADGSKGLRVIDVNFHTMEVGFYDTPGNALGVYVSGSYAYMADKDKGLRIIDVSNPKNPVEVGFLDTPGNAKSVFVSGSYAYVADESKGLRIIDVSNPQNPVEVGFCNAYALDVYVKGSYAYVASLNTGLHIIDVSNPQNPVEVGSLDTPGWAVGVYVSGDYAYVADDFRGLRVIDVSNPQNPVEVGFYDDVSGDTLAVYVLGNYAYVASSGVLASDKCILVIDVSNPYHPQKIGSQRTPDMPSGVYVSGSYAYLSDEKIDLLAIDVSNPENPVEMGSHGTPGVAYDVYVSGKLIYVADGSKGLRIIDVDFHPVEVGFYSPSYDTYDVYVLGNYAYLADGDYGLRVIDVSNPQNPVEVGFYDTPGDALGVYVSGNYAYVADNFRGLRVIDVSNPQNPVEVGFYDTPGHAGSVYVSGSYAYVADGSRGLRVNLSNPQNPMEVGFCNAYALGIYVEGSYAYVADYSGLRIIDVSNPKNPAEVSSHDTPGNAESVFVSGSHAYVADNLSGLRIIDVSNPQNPMEVGSYDTPADRAYGVFVSGRYTYVADYSGLRVIDVSNPQNPVEVGFYDTPGHDVYVSDGLIYVAAGHGGLYILRYRGGSRASDTSPPTITILSPKALSLDGNGDYVEVPNYPSINFTQNANFTIEGWFLTTQNSSPHGDTSLVEKWKYPGGGGYPYVIRLLTPSGQLKFAVYDGSKNPSVSSLIPINDGKWHHFACVKQGASFIEIYIDGQLKDKNTNVSTGNTQNDTSLFFGRRGGTSMPNFFDGLIDEVRIWNIARTQDEIQATMNTTLQGNESGLVGYWNFDDGTANDSSPYDNHGTLKGDAAIVDADTPLENGEITSRVLSITSAEVSPGAKATIQLSITDATGIAAGDILVKYDADVIIVGEIKGTDLISGINLIVNKNVSGEITLSLAGIEGIPSGSGALTEIELEVNNDAKAGTETMLEFASAQLYDESGASIPIKLENGTVKIVQLSIKGDVNNDGKVRSNDALLALRIAAGLMEPTDAQKWAADMNDDGKIRSNDALLILRKAAGLAAPDIQPAVAIGRPITLMLAEAHGVAGESVTVPLNVDKLDRLAGGDIRIVYDSTVLKAVDVSSNSNVFLASNISEPGMVRITFASADGLKSKTIAEIRFNIIADDVSPLSFQQVELYRSDAVPVDSKKIDGRFTSWAIPPKHSALLPNFPNPFNPDTWIPYQLAQDSYVTIRIYDGKGQLIRLINLGAKPAGLYFTKDRAVYWDGRNNQGEKVVSGLYFYQLKAGDFSAVRKMVIVK